MKETKRRTESALSALGSPFDLLKWNFFQLGQKPPPDFRAPEASKYRPIRSPRRRNPGKLNAWRNTIALPPPFEDTLVQHVSVHPAEKRDRRGHIRAGFLSLLSLSWPRSCPRYSSSFQTSLASRNAAHALGQPAQNAACVRISAISSLVTPFFLALIR